MDSLPKPKELKKLADACRKAGIKSFKGFGIEFTLSDEVPVSNYKKKAAIASHTNDKLDADGWETLSEDEKLFWSTTAPGESEEATG